MEMNTNDPQQPRSQEQAQAALFRMTDYVEGQCNRLQDALDSNPHASSERKMEWMRDTLTEVQKAIPEACSIVTNPVCILFHASDDPFYLAVHKDFINIDDDIDIELYNEFQAFLEKQKAASGPEQPSPRPQRPMR